MTHHLTGASIKPQTLQDHEIKIEKRKKKLVSNHVAHPASTFIFEVTKLNIMLLAVIYCILEY